MPAARRFWFPPFAASTKIRAMQQTTGSSELATLIHRLTSIVERLDVAGLFSQVRLLEVELGSGDGSFIVNYARLHPETNFLAVERLLGRLNKINRKGLRAGLTNLRGLRIESAYFLEYLLPPKSVTALHVYFPDPWPKRKHWKNRLINERFPELARRILAPGGSVYLRTDHAEYFEQMTAVFRGAAAFCPVEMPAELSEVITDFERGFNTRGVRTLRAAYRLLHS
jgi:tRNA (guanine-N7-)-methyltransferase